MSLYGLPLVPLPFHGLFSVFSPTTVVLDRRSSPSGFSANERGHFRKYTAPLAVPITEKDCESQAAKAPEGLDPALASQRSVCCSEVVGVGPVGRLGKISKGWFCC